MVYNCDPVVENLYIRRTLRRFPILSTFIVELTCLLYTSDAADERSSVDLGGRRIIKKKTKRDVGCLGNYK